MNIPPLHSITIVLLSHFHTHPPIRHVTNPLLILPNPMSTVLFFASPPPRATPTISLYCLRVSIFRWFSHVQSSSVWPATLSAEAVPAVALYGAVFTLARSWSPYVLGSSLPVSSFCLPLWLSSHLLSQFVPREDFLLVRSFLFLSLAPNVHLLAGKPVFSPLVRSLTFSVLSPILSRLATGLSRSVDLTPD
jgi:hypothetical protein